MSWKEEKGDLISRSALLKAMEDERQFLLARGQTGAEHILVHHCLSLIDTAPTVDALPREYHDRVLDITVAELQACQANLRPQGEWIIQRLQNGFDDVYCPFCNARPTRSEYGYYLKDKFCHECGASMKGGAEND